MESVFFNILLDWSFSTGFSCSTIKIAHHHLVSTLQVHCVWPVQLLFFFIYKGRNLGRPGPLSRLAAIGCSQRTNSSPQWTGHVPSSLRQAHPSRCSHVTGVTFYVWFPLGPPKRLHLESCPVQSVCNICVPIFPCAYTGCCFVISVLKLIFHVPFHPDVFETWGSGRGCITWVLHICDLYVLFSPAFFSTLTYSGCQ